MQLYCKACDSNKDKEEFHLDSSCIRGRAYYCKSCANTKGRIWWSQNKLAPKVQRSHKNRYIKTRFGISVEQYEELLAQQQFECAICKVELPTSGHATHLDHCHKTGKIRAFLCTNCNRGLGHFQDNPIFLESAVDYLNTHNAHGRHKEGTVNDSSH